MTVLVSVIVPCYNEEHTIVSLLDAIYQQTYPRDAIEIVVADGLSEDSTLKRIESFRSSHSDLNIRVVVNEKRIIPAALNCAIQASKGEILVRLDAHSIPYPDYIERCVADLEDGKGENVGGVWVISPGKDGFWAEAIAHAAAHPMGVGDARYRYTQKAGYVDTVPFGAFHRAIFDELGLFDESLLTNEDYEFNTRIRLAGGRVWLDPDIRSTYLARSSVPALIQQYWRYGFWKARMLIRYPKTLRWRQAIPPLFILSLLILGVSSIWSNISRWLLALVLAAYMLFLISVGFQIALKNRNIRLLLSVPLVIASMHLSWGTAFLWSTSQVIFGKNDHI